VLDDLESVVSDHFDLRQELREAELEDLERGIERLRSLHERRQDEKNRIVQQRIESLLREAVGLGWGSPRSSSIAAVKLGATTEEEVEEELERLGELTEEEVKQEWREKLSEEADSEEEEEGKEERYAAAKDLNARFEAGELTAMEAFEEACKAAVRRGGVTEEKMEEMVEALAKLSEATEEEVEKEWREWFAEVAESNEEEERRGKEEREEEMRAIARDLNARFEAGELTAREAFEEACKAAVRLGGTEEKAAEALAKLDELTEEEIEKTWRVEFARMADLDGKEERKEEMHAIAKDLNAQLKAGELTAREVFEEACKAAVRLGIATEERMAEQLATLDGLTEEEIEEGWRKEFAKVAESEEEEERSEEFKEEVREEMHAIARDLNAQFEAGELTAREAFEEAAKAARKLGADEEEVAEKLAKVGSLTDEELEKAWREQIAKMPDSEKKDD